MLNFNNISWILSFTQRVKAKRKNEQAVRRQVIVDSTCMKIYGEGEWSREKHKTKTRKAWRKLHVAIDEDGNILTSSLTKNNVDDSSEIPELMNQIDGNISLFLGDRAYDNEPVRNFL